MNDTLQFTLDKIQEALDRDLTMEQLKNEVESELLTHTPTIGQTFLDI